jgi:phosphomannomutase
MGVTTAIKRNHFEAMEKRGWDKTYWAFDLHSTVIKPNYEAGNIPTEFYPLAKEVLQFLTKQDDVCMIMYTCSHPHEIDEYIRFFEEHGIVFEHINANPEVPTDVNGYGCYDTKFYMNVLFEDKAGFDAETEWEEVRDLLNEKYNAEITEG